MKAQQDVIRRAGLKITMPRIQVLQCLQHNQENGAHLTAEGIYHFIFQHGDAVSQAAVYRVLSQFEEAGLVRRHHFATNRMQAVYELTQGATHNHIVCLDSGLILDFTDNTLNQKADEIAAARGYDLVNREFVLYVRSIKGA